MNDFVEDVKAKKSAEARLQKGEVDARTILKSFKDAGDCLASGFIEYYELILTWKSNIQRPPFLFQAREWSKR